MYVYTLVFYHGSTLHINWLKGSSVLGNTLHITKKSSIFAMRACYFVNTYIFPYSIQVFFVMRALIFLGTVTQLSVLISSVFVMRAWYFLAGTTQLSILAP